MSRFDPVTLRWRQIETILDQAFDLPSEERTRLLAETCGDDRDLRREVEILLEADRERAPILDSPLDPFVEPLLRDLAERPAEPRLGELSAGTRLGSYEILDRIGAGGMGEVYLARDTRLGRKVAIKILRRELAADERRTSLFAAEARSASALNHPNIVTVHDVGWELDRHYLVMEHVEGRTLRRLLRDHRLSFSRLLRFATQIAAGLAKAHGAGIVHRDLKPENLMISEDGIVKILDFGVAKLAPSPAVPEDPEGGSAETLRRAPYSRALGTAAYMSPEQARGESTDFRSDQFSLGAILYEMATGTAAFRRKSAEETLAAVIEQEPDPPLGVHVPWSFRRLVGRCLAKDPRGRHASTRELARELQRMERRHQPSTEVFVPTFEPVEDSGAIRSLAILPLVDLGAAPEQEYFADGMTEALIAGLARIRTVRVISRTSVMRFKGSPEPLPDIARRLGVASVMEGSIQRCGDRVRITVRLVHGERDAQLWSRTYERETGDLLALQHEISRAVAREIRPSLATSQQSPGLASSCPVRSSAHEPYLLGRYHLNRRTTLALEKSVECFETAIRRDPGYAPAYGGMADALAVLAGGGHGTSARDLVRRAREAATRALELDETLPEAHTSLGYLRFKFDWDWCGAERAFRRAIELGPDSAAAHQWYALFLSLLARHEEAREQIRQAQELDPLSRIVHAAASRVCQFARDYEEALGPARKALELDPGFAEGHFNLGLCHRYRGSFDAAVAELRKALEISPERPLYLVALANAWAQAGCDDEVHQTIRTLEALSAHKRVTATEWSIVYAGLGEVDEAFRCFDEAIEQRDGLIVYLGVEPMADVVRDDPRYVETLRKAGLPESEGYFLSSSPETPR